MIYDIKGLLMCLNIHLEGERGRKNNVFFPSFFGTSEVCPSFSILASKKKKTGLVDGHPKFEALSKISVQIFFLFIMEGFSFLFRCASLYVIDKREEKNRLLIRIWGLSVCTIYYQYVSTDYFVFLFLCKTK